MKIKKITSKTKIVVGDIIYYDPSPTDFIIEMRVLPKKERWLVIEIDDCKLIHCHSLTKDFKTLCCRLENLTHYYHIV